MLILDGIFFYKLKVDFSILFFTVCHTHCISGCSTFNVMNDEVNDNLISNLSLSFNCLSTTYTSCARFPDKVLQSLSEVEALSQIVPRIHRKFGWHVDQISKWYCYSKYIWYLHPGLECSFLWRWSRILRFIHSKSS